MRITNTQSPLKDRKKGIFLLLLLLCFSLLSCQQPVALPFDHDAYIWQHKWTPELTDAIKQSSPYIKKWRILAAEVTPTGMMKKIAVNPSIPSLKVKQIVLVFRINGQFNNWNPETTIKDISNIIRHYTTTNYRITGIEIDHDCANSKLQGYITFLKKIRRLAIIKNKTLSITVLPSWMNSPLLTTLLALTDQAVLQVHSVSDPKQGLINSNKAKQWIKTFDNLTPVPFHVALPTYHSQVGWNNKGQIIGIESEVRKSFSRQRVENIISDPSVINRLIMQLHQYDAQWLQGIVWFRLPTIKDQRAWSLTTWFNVLQEKKIAPKFKGIALHSVKNTYDIHLINDGSIDAILPSKIKISSKSGICYAADGLKYYQQDKKKGAILFIRVKQGILKIGQKRIIGWVHCKGEEIKVDVEY